eukprot:11092408-Prorocentrum_lima.AAC.1
MHRNSPWAAGCKLSSSTAMPVRCNVGNYGLQNPDDVKSLGTQQDKASYFHNGASPTPGNR